MQANRANPTTPRTTPKLSLRERQRAAVRAEITLAAMELFLAHGFDETTADQIAERAGCLPQQLLPALPDQGGRGPRELRDRR